PGTIPVSGGKLRETILSNDILAGGSNENWQSGPNQGHKQL
ncbi:unnamed protein product, partial [Rotaria sp. Silwood1]